MKLAGLDYFDLSKHLTDNECMIQQSTREFVENEILPIINEHVDNGTNVVVTGDWNTALMKLTWPVQRKM